jgi:hypothetical protein
MLSSTRNGPSQTAGWATADLCSHSRRYRVSPASAERQLGFCDRLVSLDWEQTIVDARDPSALREIWGREALGWTVVNAIVRSRDLA